MSNNLTFTSGIFGQLTNFLPADTTVAKTVLTADATYMRRIYAIAVYSSDTSARDIIININDGTNTRKLSTVSIPANSGNTNAIVTLDLFANGQLLAFFSKNRDSQGVPYYNIPIGYSITMSMGATITATKEVNVYVYGELYN
jgi:hypothetical protein